MLGKIHKTSIGIWRWVVWQLWIYKETQVVMEKEELFGEELDQIIDLYPPSTYVLVVEDEEHVFWSL